MTNAEARPSEQGVCLTDDEVLAFIDGGLGKGEVARADLHLRACPACATLVSHVLAITRDSPQEAARLRLRCSTFEAGECVAARYYIRRALGHGGMGEVYEALDLQLGREVAIKAVRATECDDPRASQRLALEFELAQRVCHPNVCRVFDFGVHREPHVDDATICFFTMEFIDGESLEQRLWRGPPPFEEFRLIALRLLQGVAALHDAGIIHRDIKSHNVMLRGDALARVVLIDFGLAVDAARWVPESAPRNLSSFFRVEGSPAYMAPEQFREVVLTPATDVFACGVVLFQALTGKLPFRSLRRWNKGTLLRDPNEVPLRAIQVAPSIPRQIDDFIARCLDSNPGRRYRNGGKALEALHRALQLGGGRATYYCPSPIHQVPGHCRSDR